MTGVPPSDRGNHARAKAAGVRRIGWFSRARVEMRLYDQEAEVRAQLYAKPDPTERTVEHVGRIEHVERAARIEPVEPVEPVELVEPVGRIKRAERIELVEPVERAEAVERRERIADRPAA
jgi:hypothetical protein